MYCRGAAALASPDMYIAALGPVESGVPSFPTIGVPSRLRELQQAGSGPSCCNNGI
jgi:hypothetical protein